MRPISKEDAAMGLYNLAMNNATMKLVTDRYARLRLAVIVTQLVKL